MIRRELIEKAPIDNVVARIRDLERAAKSLHDARVATILADVRRDLEQAIADAQRPPEVMSVREEAAREGVSVSAVYKRRQRAARPAV